MGYRRCVRTLQRKVAILALFPLLCCAALLASPGGALAACASGLYGATGSGGVAGSLYCIDPTTGAGTLIGPLVDASNNEYGMTGLAFQPSTAILFGSTTTNSPTAAGHLVQINPQTAVVTDVGSFNLPFSYPMSDITFDPTSGILYGSSGGTGYFYAINPMTGTATAVGLTGVAGTHGGGLATNAAGTIYGTPDGADGSLYTYNKATGAASAVASLSGAPITGVAAINALAFDGGTLFGINNKRNVPPPHPTHLVTIDTTTGVISDVGPSVDDLDALTLFQAPTRPRPTAPALGEWGLILLAILLVATGWWALDRRRTFETLS